MNLPAIVFSLFAYTLITACSRLELRLVSLKFDLAGYEGDPFISLTRTDIRSCWIGNFSRDEPGTDQPPEGHVL